MTQLEELKDTIFILPHEVGLRMDRLLADRFQEFSRTYFQHLIEQGCVLLNGLPIKKRISPQEGDEVEICFQARPSPSMQPESIPLNILYEDEHLLAVNKEDGMVTHPAPGNWSGTFVNALLAHCDNLAPGNDPIRPGIVHRLDKETSGVLLAAKTEKAHQKLIEAFSKRSIEKAYLAICVGKPVNQTISAPIGRHPVKRKEMTVLEGGKEAFSVVQTLAFNHRLSLVLIRPKTGRTHQIRVHMKHIGCPILGDSLYGSESVNHSLGAKRLLLHAYQLHLSHPITSEPMKFLAPIPEDFKHWMLQLSLEKQTI